MADAARKILIAGASSRLGRTVALRLLAEGFAVRAASRTPANIADLATAGAEAAALDLRRPSAFPQALEGVAAVFTSVHALVERSAGSIDAVDAAGHMALIDAARAAGVARFVYTSAMGARADHPAPLWRAKAKVEDHLRSSGLAYVILRPSAFMDFHAHELIGKAVLAGKPAMLLGRGETSRNFVAVDDVARLAVEALTADRWLGETLAVGGPDNLTDREVALAYGRVAGRPVKVRSLPPPALKALAAIISPLHAGIANVLRLPLQMEGAHDLTFEGPAQPTSLDDFIRARV